jgi:hypothetical protein
MKDEAEDDGIICRRASNLKTPLEYFWNRWSCEYLLELREHHHVKGVRKSARLNPKEGDVVCVFISLTLIDRSH